MERKNIFVQLSTLGPVGYMPAPGTAATLATLPVIYLLSLFDLSFAAYGIITVIATIFSLKIIGKALEHFKMRDPSEIVLDEFVGCLVVFCAIPISLSTLAVGFVAFRFFDILKPLGIRTSEFLYGSLGVVVDDLLAGLMAHFVVRLFLYYW